MPSGIRKWISKYWPIAILLLIPIAYLGTLARGLVLGDPTEYTFVSHILGIAHPPGYAFYTILGKLFQVLIPLGEIPWRMHLLSSMAAFLSSIFVYGTVHTIADESWGRSASFTQLNKVIALFAALTMATAVNIWQHAIHANPHIITAAFLTANLFFLTRWWAAQSGTSDGQEKKIRGFMRFGPEGWLYAFSLSAGLGLTHHPLTAVSLIAYGIFIVYVRPGIWREWKLLARMIAFAMLGLSIWLYYPIRSAMGPEFGPHDMNTLDGFLNHVLARGLTESLPFFGLSDFADRGLVFWTLLRNQYSLLTIFLAVVGAIWMIFSRQSVFEQEDARPDGRQVQSRKLRPLALLYILVFLSNYFFVMNLRQQDIMAYLLGILMIVALMSGTGVIGLVDLLRRRVGVDFRTIGPLLIAIYLLGPVLQVVRNLPRVSLAAYHEGDDYIEAVFDWFSGKDSAAVLLNDWEHMTPLWYSRYVEDRWPEQSEVEPHFVSTDRPWLESVYDYLPGAPVYLSGYRPEIVSAGFRLRPRDIFYQVVEPGDITMPDEIREVDVLRAGDIEITGYELPQREVKAGDFVPLSLAMRTPAGTDSYYTPVLSLGSGEDRLVMEFTTDGHLTTPQWLPDEIIIERFDFALPHDLPSGTYPLSVGIRNLSDGTDTEGPLLLGNLEVAGQDHPPDTSALLANFRQRIGLVSASARSSLFQRRKAYWEDPLLARQGDTILLTLQWQSLALAEESYTVFVHLIDQSNFPYLALDYTPLGGSSPTHLWIPKWLPGQRYLDPYRLKIPDELTPGTYFIEVGLYEMTSGRRLHMSDAEGNLVGDRYILGPVEVEG